MKSETEIRADREIYRERIVEARATERSGGNVSYAQHVIFEDPSEHFFVGGTFAHPLHVSLRARAYVCVSFAKETKRNAH